MKDRMKDVSATPSSPPTSTRSLAVRSPPPPPPSSSSPLKQKVLIVSSSSSSTTTSSSSPLLNNKKWSSILTTRRCWKRQYSLWITLAVSGLLSIYPIFSQYRWDTNILGGGSTTTTTSSYLSLANNPHNSKNDIISWIVPVNYNNTTINNNISTAKSINTTIRVDHHKNGKALLNVTISTLPIRNTNSSTSINHETTSSSSQSQTGTTTLPAPTITTTTTTVRKAKYAYAFVVGGCDPNKPSYRGYLYNIMNSAYILQQHGSQSDVIVFIQMSYTSTHSQLLEHEEQWLTHMNIQIQYIPKHRQESFYTTQMDKFRILGLTQYRRVLYMDSDVMPFANLDYLFELSDVETSPTESGIKAKHPITFQPNLLVSGKYEPANGGFFMLAPNPGSLRQVNEIIQKKFERGKTIGFTGTNPWERGFDPVIGWGHKFIPPDQWVSTKEQGQNWTFLAAFADQGLLYHYGKYVCQNVTIVLGDRIQNWKQGPAREPVMFEEHINPLKNYSRLHYNMSEYSSGCLAWAKQPYCSPPYSDFTHFTGRGKPWMSKPPKDLLQAPIVDPKRLWWATLTILNKKLKMGLDSQLQNWDTGDKKRANPHSPLLGLYPTYGQAQETVIDLLDSEHNTGVKKITAHINRTNSPMQLKKDGIMTSAATAVSAVPIHSNRSQYAYAYVVGGCDPDRPAYRGYVYNILISVYILRRHGSKADVIVFFQLSYKSNHTVLTHDDEQWLNQMKIRFKYIPKHPKESFYTAQMDKFRILSLTEYKRVLYMDSDVMPFTSLDYLFELSDRSTNSSSVSLQPNLLLAGVLEPANGGFFMLAPAPSALKDVNNIIQQKFDRGKNIGRTGTNPYERGFDSVIGWGNPILPPDSWETTSGSGYNWTFHAAFADQGLLYYYGKYICQNVTILVGNRVQHWTMDIDKKPLKYEERMNGLGKYKMHHYNMTEYSSGCLKWVKESYCSPPYSDFIHFTGRGKPWMSKPPEVLQPAEIVNPVQLWWATLTVLDKELSMGIYEQLRNWTTGNKKGSPQSPLLGMYPTYGQAQETLIDLLDSKA